MQSDVSLFGADFSGLAKVQAARAASAGGMRSGAQFVVDNSGQGLLSAYAAVAKPPGWMLFVEVPAEKADVLAR
jgi:hypothetical protein